MKRKEIIIIITYANSLLYAVRLISFGQVNLELKKPQYVFFNASTV